MKVSKIEYKDIITIFKKFENSYFETKENVFNFKYKHLFKNKLPFYYDFNNKIIFINKNFIYKSLKYKGENSIFNENLSYIIKLIKNKSLNDIFIYQDETENFIKIQFVFNYNIETFNHILNENDLFLNNNIEFPNIKIFFDSIQNIFRKKYKTLLEHIHDQKNFIYFYFYKNNLQNNLRKKFIDINYEYLKNYYNFLVDKDFDYNENDLITYKRKSLDLNLKTNNFKNIIDFLNNNYLLSILSNNDTWNFDLKNLNKLQLIYIPNFMKIVL